MIIEIPEFALIVLAGAPSSGKTSFAYKHFLPSEILSYDNYTRNEANNSDQLTTIDSFNLLCSATENMLSQTGTAIIDATNFQYFDRRKLLKIARDQNVDCVVIVFNLPESVLIERNDDRSDRNVPVRVIRKHSYEIRQSIQSMPNEGFRSVYILNSLEEIDRVEIIRTKMQNNRKEFHGPFDIIGDIHGCYDELLELFLKLGYRMDDQGIPYHPDGRIVAFLGDLCDRGPRNVAVIRLVMEMVRTNRAICILGNHDVKLQKYLAGRSVEIHEDLKQTIIELSKENASFQNEVRVFLEQLVTYYVLDSGKLVISHAGIKETFIGKESGRINSFCLYGEITGENDEFGLPIRLNWAESYHGNAAIVYGHTPRINVQSLNNTYCIDTGCALGGKLTAMRYPEMETVSVKAMRQYCQPPHLLLSTNESQDNK